MSASAAGLVLIAFALGSIPFGLILGRAVAGVDVRAAGSGNIGATNVARTAGKKLGALVLLLDALKALLPALAARFLLPGQAAIQALVAAAAVLGHVFSPYLRFRGGKGVASALGALIALTPMAALGGVALFAVVFAVTRMVSLGSLLGAIFTVGLSWELGYPHAYVWFALAATLLILVRHRGNIARMLERREHRL